MKKLNNKKTWILGAVALALTLGLLTFAGGSDAAAPGGSPKAADYDRARQTANEGDPCSCSYTGHIGIDWIGGCTTSEGEPGALYREIWCQPDPGQDTCSWQDYPYGNDTNCLPL